ncbi:MAG TPA: ABC transporter permease [Bryobacteraceae bacterium]
MSPLFRKLIWFSQRRRKEAELHEELQFHLAQEAEDCKSQGLDEDEARWAARRDLGNITQTQENTRATWGWTFLEQLAQDLRYALRGFRNNPGFALTAILSLSLGLGTSLAIYTIADNLLLRPLPYSHPSQLVMVWEENQKASYLHGHVAPRNYFVWKARNTAFQKFAVFDTAHAVFGDRERAEEVTDIEADAHLLPMLGVQPVVGRYFTEVESGNSSNPVILISFRLWQSWFGGDKGILGKRVQFAGQPRTIIGVLPANFYFHNRGIDVWTPLDITPAKNGGEGRWLWCLARLKPDVTLREAQAEMSGIARRRALDDPGFNKDWTVTVEPLRDALVRNIRPSLLVLLGAVGLLLAVACANVASLLLARYTVRQREMALRASLGAGQIRVMRQLLTESLLLAAAGGTLGMLLARWAVSMLVFMAPNDLTQSLEIVTDNRIYFFGACLAMLTTIVFGLAPALAGSRSALVHAMQIDGRSSVGGRSHVRAWFVGAEIAVSVILLSGALLLFRSLQGLQHVSPGIQPANLLTLRVSLPGAHYTKPSQAIQFFARATREIDSLAGVRSASAVSHLPFNGAAPSTFVVIAGQPPRKPGEDLTATIRTVLPGYFQTIGIPLLSGRDFTAADNSENSPHRFLVNQAFVRKYLGTANPLDQRISVWMEEKNPFGQIIGVVADVHDEALDQPPTPTVYYPHAHLTYNRMVLVVRYQRDPLAAAEPVRRIIRSIDPAQPVADVRSMEQVIAATFSRQHFITFLLTGFSGASLLLAAIGVFGILAYSVSERTREIGVRVAIGATPGRIVSLIVRAAAYPLLGGVAIGISGALALTGLLHSLLFGIGPHDPLTFLFVPAIVAIVALLAAYVPARRAARLDPMAALRAE